MTWNDVMQAIEYGQCIGEHPGDTKERVWDNESHMWLRPGEFLIEHNGNRYIVSARQV